MTRGTFSWAACLALPLILLSAPVFAADDERPRWLPYFEAAVDLHKDNAKAEINTSYGFGTEEHWHNSPPGIRLGLGLLTPPIDILPGKPRPFVDVGVTILPETNQTLTELGTLDFDLIIPDNTNNPMRIGPPVVVGGNPKLLPGQGSRIINEHHNPIANVGVGLEFVLPWLDKRLRLKPSVEYEWERITTKGRLFELFVDIGDVVTSQEYVDVDVSKDTDFHSLGVGAELEFVVTGGLSLFLETRVLFLLSDDKVKINRPRSASARIPAGNTEIVYNRNDIPAFHGGFGFRYSFIGL